MIKLSVIKVFVFALMATISAGVHAKDLILTGQISSSAKQIVNAPQSSRWQLQIQWMEDEGKIVQKGQAVVVFDGANEQSQLILNQENLDRLLLELTQLEIVESQNVMDAEGRVKIAKMRVGKAQIEASVPSGEVSSYDKGQYELALHRAILEQVQAEEALISARQEEKTEITQKKVAILRTQEEIAYLNDILSKLNVLAKVSGPVSYAIHPWYGSKVTAGMSVRASWKILDVQSTHNFQIESWIHEIDAVGLLEDTKVNVTLDAYPDKTYSATIKYLSKQSEKKTQWSKSAYFPTLITFDSPPDINLMPGMSVRIIVNKGAIKHV